MTKRTLLLGLVLTLAAGAALLADGLAFAIPPDSPKTGMICTPGTVSGSTHTFNLVANTGYIQTPDGNSILMWSYADSDAPDLGAFQTPGPVLCVTQGETVVVNLHNTLPEPVSIVFPGQVGVTASGGAGGLLTTEAAADGDVSYTFAAAQPGTYAYESGSNVSKQLEMGLYGALIVRPSIGANFAYDATTEFNPQREYLILLNEIDPDLHHAVETGGPYDFNTLHNRYFAVNGREFPDTLLDNGTALLPGQPYGALVRIQPYDAALNPLPALVRMINVGELNHPYHPHGDHMTQIAQDGRLLLTPSGDSASTERFGETIASGQTQDYIISWVDQDMWSPTAPGNQFPVSQPNYRNLTFKDGNTWYSGNPYLGYKGTFPTGTTTHNICGEWYFPWHSHALNEFTNFDEGFGGMATLLRVDPLGGCLAFPTGTRIEAGSLNSGTFSRLAVANSSYYMVNSTTSGNPRTTSWYAQFSGIPAGAANLTVTYVGSNSRANVSQTLYIWNWTAGAWVPISGPTTVGTANVTVTVSIPTPTPPAAYIGTGSNKGLVRIRVGSTRTGTLNFVNRGDLMKLTYDAP